MTRFLASLALGALLVLGLAAGFATNGLADDSGPPNQGDADKVLTVSSGYVCTGTITWSDKVEGGLGTTISVSAATPIVKVTIKSGEKAVLVSATWAADYRSGTITISQDVSNYVVWTCTGSTTTTTDTTTTGTTTTGTTTTTTTTTGTTTTTTTETTPTTTTGETTTTDTTETTETETTPAGTEATPTVPMAPLTPPSQPAEEAAPAQTTPARPAAPLTPPTKAGTATGEQPTLAYTP